MQNVSMIILAGGKSSRMGTDKSDLLYGDKSFLEIQADKARTMNIRDVLISGYRGQQHLDFPIIPDLNAEQGPLGGLTTCLGAMQNEWALVLSVDAPLVPVEELKRIVNFALQGQYKAAIAQCDDRQYPLVGMYHRSLVSKMQEELTNHRGSVFAMLRRVGYGVYESKEDPTLFSNVNDPKSYRNLLNR